MPFFFAFFLCIVMCTISQTEILSTPEEQHLESLLQVNPIKNRACPPLPPTAAAPTRLR